VFGMTCCDICVHHMNILKFPSDDKYSFCHNIHASAWRAFINIVKNIKIHVIWF
jgi:hypothetical protein